MSNAQSSYLQLQRGIDLARSKRLDQEPADDPMRAVERLVIAHSRSLGWTDLRAWEQMAQSQELYIPPNNCYAVTQPNRGARPVGAGAHQQLRGQT